jgi:hypothetical protein
MHTRETKANAYIIETYITLTKCIMGIKVSYL